MGTDIHAHTEIKINGTWHHFGHPQIERWYALFSRMADVRNKIGSEIEPIAEPRGLPADISWETRFDYDRMNLDAHSTSWLSGKEVEELCSWADEKHKEFDKSGNFYSLQHKQIGYIFGNGWDVKKYPKDYPEGVEEARLVFWFDC